MSRGRPALSGLEHQVMRIVWRKGTVTAEEVCAALAGNQKNATIRTILRRLEQKQYVSHRSDGRAYVYEARVAPEQAAAGAVRRIIDRFCGGSVEALLVGLVDAQVVEPGELQELSRRVARARRAKGRQGASDA
jgi:BlaI family transcriptional regulator, penicillinase repressor